MKYIVTGGTGFLGRHLVSRLEAAGHQVAVPRSASCDLLQLGQVLDFLRQRAARSHHPLGGLLRRPRHQRRRAGDDLLPQHHRWAPTCSRRRARSTPSARSSWSGTACSYPGKLENLMREEDFWAGPVHGSVENYGLTKKIMVGAGPRLPDAVRPRLDPPGADQPLRAVGFLQPAPLARRRRARAQVRRGEAQPARARYGCGARASRCASSSTSRTAPTPSSKRPTSTTTCTHPLNIGTGIGTSIQRAGRDAPRPDRASAASWCGRATSRTGRR